MTNLIFSLYASSIIIGAGILALPLSSSSLGLGHLLLIILLLGAVLAIAYRYMGGLFYEATQEYTKRQIAKIDEMRSRVGVDPNEASAELDRGPVLTLAVRRGAEVLDSLLTNVGPVGPWAVLAGIALYVIPAIIGYFSFGLISEVSVGVRLGQAGTGPVLAALSIGLALAVASWRLPLLLSVPTVGRDAAQKFMAMASAWLLGMAAIGLWGSDELVVGAASRNQVMGIVFFLGAILVGEYAGSSAKAVKVSDGLSPAQQVNVITLAVSLVLLLITGGFALVLFASHGMLEPITWVPVEWGSLRDLSAWSTVTGTVLFAFAGFGIFNLCSCRKVFEVPPGKKVSRFATVVLLGTVIPLIAYVFWSVIVGFTLLPSEMVTAVANDQPSHVAMAEKAAAINPLGAWIITVTGYLFALMAVTSACRGFTDSLTERLSLAIGKQRSASGKQRRAVSLKLAVLFTGAGLALLRIALEAPIDFNGLLSIAGYAGGGIILLVLPFFFRNPKHNGRSQPGFRDKFGALAAASTAVVLCTLIVATPGGGAGIVGGLTTAAKLCSGAIVIVTTISLLWAKYARSSQWSLAKITP